MHHALEDDNCQDVIDAMCHSSMVEIAARQFGPHLPKIGLQAGVSVCASCHSAALYGVSLFECIAAKCEPRDGLHRRPF